MNIKEIIALHEAVYTAQPHDTEILQTALCDILNHLAEREIE